MALRNRLGQARRALRLPAPPAVKPWRRVVALVPAPSARAWSPQAGPVDVYAIYRRRNAATVALLLEGDGLRASLWALDEVAPALGDRTVGTGPGTKFALLNRLLAEQPPRSGSTVVFVDDDVAVGGGGLAALSAWGVRAELDLYQPAHAARSHASHAITVAVPGSLVRRTTFVEIGPVFVVRGAATQAVLPFPADAGMGWGLELAWSDLERDGLRLGVVDAVRMDHLTPVATGYDDTALRRSAGARLADAGATRWSQLQHVRGRWWRWQRQPPWRL